MPPAAPTTSRRARKVQAPAMRFDQRLVLNQWILGLFEADSFIPLTDGSCSVNASRSSFAARCTSAVFQTMVIRSR